MASSRALKPLDLKLAGASAIALGLEDLHLDRVVRAHDRALAAVDADVGVPDRQLRGQPALLVARGAGREGAVDGQGADGQQVALAGEDAGGDALRRSRARRRAPADGSRLVEVTRSGHDQLVQLLQGAVDRGEVAVDHLRAAAAVAAHDGIADRGDRLLRREDAGEREEAGLHHGVDAVAQADLAGDAVRVDHVDAQLFVQDRLLRRASGSASQACSAGNGRLSSTVAPGRALPSTSRDSRIDELVARHEVGLVDEVASSRSGAARSAGATRSARRTSWSRRRSSPARAARCARRRSSRWSCWRRRCRRCPGRRRPRRRRPPGREAGTTGPPGPTGG